MMPVSYTAGQRRFLEHIEQALRDHMRTARPQRYEHSLSVARTAEDMALHYAQDPFEARVAGTLHDWDKVLPNDEQLALARRQGIDLGVDLELVCPLLHGITAAGHLREEFPELSDAVLRAIALHTLGSTDMRPLDMIVFVADAIEPLRPSGAGIDQVRALVRDGAPLEEAYASCFCSGVEYVIRTRRYLYPKTLDVYNHLVLTHHDITRTHKEGVTMAQTPLTTARVAATAADDKKATDIVLIDLAGVSDVCDYFLICTVASGPQMDAVLEGIRERVATSCGMKPISMEGREGGTWVVMDYGSLVVHVFRPEARDYFRLERLWGEAPRVPLDLEGAAGAPAGSSDDTVGEH